MINPFIFKAYDIRGIYPEEINKDIAYRVGQAYVAETGAQSIVVGRDMRTSSPELFDALTEGLTDAGADVIDIGLVATPEFYFAVAEFEYDGGIMVTASHNPSKYNGLKVVRKGAVPMGGSSGLDKIKKRVLAEETVRKPKGTIIETDVLESYLDKVFSLVAPKMIDQKIRVVVDTGNGMAGVIEPMLWKRLKNKMMPLHLKLDGNFPHHEPDPSKPENLKDLSAKVLETHADLGVAFDGDGDRVGFVNERGEPVRGDLMLALLAGEILKNNPGRTVLHDVRCSTVVSEEVTKGGGKSIMSPVGHAPIKKQMRELDALFGGELSMHYYFRDFYTAECSDLVMLYVLRLMSEQKKKLGELIAPLRRYYHSGEINFEVTDKKGMMEKIEKKFTSFATHISKLDGLRMDFEDPHTRNFLWWFSVRLSNTEPLLRLNIEARTKGLLDNKRAELEAFIKGV